MLEDGPSRHLSGALRLQRGAPLILFNGEGGEFAAEIQQVDRRAVQVRVLAFRPLERESGLAVHLGLAISRGDRMDYAVQKSTELGVTAIHPLVTERTEVRLAGERRAKKVLHWLQVALSACEQCGRNRPPVIHEVMSLDTWLKSAPGSCKLVLDHRRDDGLATRERPDSVSLLIGPEGGLAGAEVEAARSAGFRSLRLGPRILRTETAPVVALGVLQFQWGDLRGS